VWPRTDETGTSRIIFAVGGVVQPSLANSGGTRSRQASSNLAIDSNANAKRIRTERDLERVQADGIAET
jgi:hypothetical protein